MIDMNAPFEDTAEGIRKMAVIAMREFQMKLILQNADEPNEASRELSMRARRVGQMITELETV